MDRLARRTYLAGVASLGGVAGCLGGGSGTDTPGGTPTTTDAPGRLVVEPAEQPLDAPSTVYPATLREWLRTAADTGETVRGYAGTYRTMPQPVLPQFDAVRLETPDGEVDGTYDLAADGGTRYGLLVGATPADPPADASVTPVEQLPEARREFAGRAIASDEWPEVYPETALGEWVRQDFFGGYYEHAGDVYEGTEIQQTDAAFFSARVWYVLAMDPATRDDAVHLRMPEIDPTVSGVVDDVLDARDPGAGRTARLVEDLPDAVVEFAAETASLLTHAELLTVEVER